MLSKVTQILSKTESHNQIIICVYLITKYVLSNIQLPINVNQEIEPILSELQRIKINEQESDILTNLINDSEVRITKNDKKLCNFVIYDQITRELSPKLDPKQNSILSAFLHHFHQLMYSEISRFSFSSPKTSEPFKSTESLIQRMAQTKENEKFIISTTNPSFTPFIVDDEFNCSSSYDIRTFASNIVDVCINNNNNQQIAYASKGVFTSLIFQHSTTFDETVTETTEPPVR